MSYSKTCPRRGAHLDPGKVCDCEIKAIELPLTVRAVAVENRDGSFSIYTNALLPVPGLPRGYRRCRDSGQKG